MKAAFGILISPEMLTVHGRLLSAPQLQYDGTTPTPDHAEWYLLGNHHFYKQAPMPKWAVLRLGGAKVPNSATRKLEEILNTCGMTFTRPEHNYDVKILGEGDDDENDNAIKIEMDKIMKAGISILLVILNTASAAVYARVKYWGDTTNGRSSD